MRTRAQDTAPIDVAYLASTYGLSATDLQALIDAPTTDLVKDFLESITTIGEQYDTLKAEKLKVDVELENVVRTTDTKVKAQKAAVTRHTKEVEDLRTTLNETEAARESLATELEQLRSSATGSTAESQALRQRIDTLQASNRDALALVESKSTEKDRVATELSEQHAKLLALRRDLSQLEERNQTLENAASSQKFKEQSLQQEMELLKRNSEWHANELQTRSQEHTAFRKEKNTRISTLQRELEESNASAEALKRSEATLRQRLDESQSKADEAFARTAALQEEAARKEQDFHTELSSSKRLADLQAQNAATHKARLLEVQRELDQVRDDSRDEVGRLQAEVETERMDKEDAERRVADLELKVEDLERRPLRPTTPRQNGGSDPQTPGRTGSRAASPSVLPGSMRKIVGGLSFTQLYTQYTEAQEELQNERRRSEKLTTALDELITEVEAKRPEVEDLRSDHERLEEEVMSFSKLVDDANEAREKAVQDAKESRGEAEYSTRRCELLQQQVRDLSAQIKILLVEVQSRDQGLGEMSVDERLELERAARGELDDAALAHMSDTARLISERLVIFHNVSELQEKNAQLLQSTRVAGERLEGKEALDRDMKSAAQQIEDLQQEISRYKDEMAATATQISSYVKERDMFRRMLQHRGQLGPDADLQSIFGQSVPPATPQRNSVGPPATPRSKDIEDLNKLLKEQQAFFDQYRNESSTDRRMLKEQADALGREKSHLQGELVKAQSQLNLAKERLDMLQANYKSLQTENENLQKRSQQMAEQAAQQDLHTQQVAEQLVEERSMKESLRHENANVKAEKELWKRIEARLTEDCKSLTDERSRLNKLVADLQNLQNERELTDSESRRRLQTRVDTLESELTDTKKKLENEAEETRKTTLRREYEEGQSRTRIDDLVKSLGNVREELVAAKTTRDQLQSRVDEMKIELRSAEEKVVALQPRPTPRPEPIQNGEQPADNYENELPAEQRLAVEISELRRDLELARTELENSKQQIEQFRAIAQSTEEELASFNQTADQYKEDTDQVLAEKEAKIKELEQRIEDLNSELTTTNNELSELRTKADDSTRLLTEQKASFDMETSRLRDDVDRHAEEKKLFQEDIKAQAEIAQQAQQSYEDELLKHAEAAKSLQTVRKEYNDIRSEVAGLKAEADAAKVSLEHGKESWAEQREHFENELEEAKRRRQDVDQQNKLLHQNLDTFSNELAALRQGRAAEGEAQEGTPSGSTSGGNFQEVIKFLRREKEIVDVQYELSIQEGKRLQQQLDYANAQLEETRQRLAEERRQSADKSSSESSTSKLAQTINELNLFRESATTLRNEARQAREKLEIKSQDVERLMAEIAPLKGRVGDLEGDLESKEGEIKLLQDDRDHWRERTQNIISKYDRVDPAELEEMKKQFEEVRAEKERLESEQAPLREEVNSFSARLASETTAATQSLTERLEKFKGQAKEQDRKRLDRIREITAEKDSVASELEKAKTELASANTELEQTKTALEEARASAAKTDAEEGQVQEDGTTAENEQHAALQTKLAEAEAAAGEHASRAEALASQVQTLQVRVQELEAQAIHLQQQQQQQQQTEASQTALSSEQTSISAENTETLEKLKQDLATAQQEVESLRIHAATTQSMVDTDPASGEKSVAQQVAEEVVKLRTEMEQQHEVAKAQMEEETNRRIENMKGNLRRQLKESKDALRAELTSEHSAEIQRIKDEHTAAIETLNQEHKAEIERLSKAGDTAIEKAETEVKTESTSPVNVDVSKLELTETQVKDLIRSNTIVRGVVTNQIRINVEKSKAAITAKDEEISKLKAAVENASPAEDGEIDGEKVSREELQKQLEEAQKQREAAVKEAVDKVEKKTKVQLSQLSIAQAKVREITKIANATPERHVKESWDAAQLAAKAAATASNKPAPVVAAATAAATTLPPAPASPALPKPVTPASPAQMPPGSPAIQTPDQIEQQKLRARAERFGTAPATHPIPSAGGAFGRPSAPLGMGAFGQPSRPLTAAAAAPPPNPHALPFNPNASTSSDAHAPAPAAKPAPVPAPVRTTGPLSSIPQPGAAGIPLPSKLPRTGPPSRQASIGSAGPVGSGGGMQIQGAAGAAGAPRGGHAASSLPRGGFGARGGGGGGGRGGARGGGNHAANAGQKRQHDGAGEGGGEAKRTRGGGPSAGAS